MNKITTKVITEGAIYIAVAGLLSLLTRYLLMSVDSMIYYVYPLPIAIYTRKNGLKEAILVLLGSIAVSFIFANPLYALGLILPNLFAGFIFGLLDKKLHLKIIAYLVTFILLLGADYLSIYLYSIINGVDYFQETIDLVTNVVDKLGILNANITERILSICITVTLIIDSLIKLVFITCLYYAVIVRLKLIPDFRLGFHIPIKFHFSISLAFLGLVILFGFIFKLFTTYDYTYINIVMVSILVILFILSFYLIFQCCFFFSLKIKNRAAYIVLGIISFLLFPISILISFVLNLINYNFIRDAL